MKKLLLSMSALATLATGVVATPAAAQRYDSQRYDNWQSINSRQDNLNRRLEQGVRNGSLTRAEAQRLRVRFANLNRLESRYRRGGLTTWERRDLDRRFDALSRSIRSERHDREDRPWRR